MPRPKLNPTDEQRRLVRQLAAVGTKHEEIALIINIGSPKTLRKHFREELDRGTAEANAKVAGALFDKAIGGRHQRPEVLAPMPRGLGQIRLRADAHTAAVYRGA